MGWLILMMVLVPLVAFGGGTAWWLAAQARKNQLLSGDPEAARLAARADAALGRLAAGPALAGLPEGLAADVRKQAAELVDKVLPDLMARRKSLSERRQRTDLGTLEAEAARFQRELAASSEPDTRRLLDTNLALTRERLEAARQLAGELQRIDLSMQALVSNVEALEERFASGDASVPGAPELARAGRLLEELEQVQTEMKRLGSADCGMLPERPQDEQADAGRQTSGRRPVH